MLLVFTLRQKGLLQEGVPCRTRPHTHGRELTHTDTDTRKWLSLATKGGSRLREEEDMRAHRLGRASTSASGRPSGRAARARDPPDEGQFLCVRVGARSRARVRARVGASARFSIESRAVLSDTLSPRLQRASPGIASGPKWPWPGTRDIKLFVNGSYLRWGPMKQLVGVRAGVRARVRARVGGGAAGAARRLTSRCLWIPG